MHVTATLTVRPGAEAAFREFEARAAVIMARHGGRIEQATRLPAAAGDSGTTGFREVHRIFFPDEAAFAAYRTDPALEELAALRASCIASTLIETGHPGAVSFSETDDARREF